MGIVRKMTRINHHNRQLVGVDETGNRHILHTWFSVWGSYSAQIPKGKKICPSFRTLTVEKLAYME
jgi:hypothetical protein